MADFGIAEALIASAAISAASAGVNTGVQSHQAHKSRWEQEQGQRRAEQAQIAADRKAETERLEALAKQQKSTSDFSFGIDSTLAARYADAAQKWGAGTGSTKQEEEDNPFYTRGLV